MQTDPHGFSDDFEVLTGYRPLSWQRRLFDRFVDGNLPGAVDLPTGLGKTAVMALWLIARAQRAALPRRLVYVVDRRAVVDQATDFAVTVRQNLDSQDAVELKARLGLDGRSLPISTLRGQHIDNREWLDDPACTAIIVGTVDMIGSRLLFEGYGVSRKMRPYHAGLLGADALVVLDEAHLVPPFEKLLETIEGNSKQFGARDEDHKQLIPAFKLLSLSATGRERAGDVFRLKGSFEASTGQREDLDDEIIVRRLEAKKSVTLAQAESATIEEALAAHAWRLAEEGKAPIRCVVFTNEPETAENVRTQVERLAKGDKKQGRPTTEIATELFVGARRVREREDAANWLRETGFIAGSVERAKPAFLFATSAGEVGVDLDADHMVCDLVAWERMVQRLGRVNRRGEGNASVVVLLEAESKPSKAAKAAFDKPEDEREGKDRKAIAAHEAAVARVRAYKQPFEHALERLGDGSIDASPAALRALKERAVADSAIADIIKGATTPAPLRPALTRALVDAWSMSSLEVHTGRPEVAPWLRGWVDEKPQTVVVWRTHLPLRPKGTDVTKTDIEEFFEAAPPHASELLETETFRVEEWLRGRCQALLKRQQPVSSRDCNKSSDDQLDVLADREPVKTAIQPLRRSDLIAFVLSKSGELRETLRMDDFFEPDDKVNAYRLNRKLQTLIGGVIVIDARLGGERAGRLDDSSSDVVETADNCDAWLPPVPPAAGAPGRAVPVVKFRARSVSVSDPDDPESNWRERYRFVTERDEEGRDLRWVVVDKWRADSTNENDRASSNNPQLLSEHQSWTEARARSLAGRLGIGGDYAEALALAARLHDEGKKASRWQRAFKAPAGSVPYAKTRGPVSFAMLDGYRHEFGSLPYAEIDEAFKPLPAELKDLVLHLIAAHHGQARPVIDTRSCEDAPPSALEVRARQVALRFARLQKRWGPWGLAWWEALLRAADQQASRANDDRSGKDI